jgi:GT2 family glycosyltransferase
MKKRNTPVSIIIPTFNGLKLLKKNLPTVESLMIPGDELIVVDDASQDESASWLISRYGLIKTTEHKEYDLYLSDDEKKNGVVCKLVVNKDNSRFALSSNRGVEQAQNRLIFLLNNDVTPDSNCLENLVDKFEEEDVFGVGCLEYEGSNKKGKKGGKNILWFDRGIFRHERAKDFKAGSAAWVSGGSGMFDRLKWLELAGFDIHYYPAYWEDIDLSMKARKRDWQVLFEPKAFVYHAHETTNAKVFSQKTLTKISWQNSDYFTVKHANFWQSLAYYIWRPYWWYQRRKQLNLL